METTLTQDQYDQLIGNLYQGVLEATPWQSFLAMLQQTLDASVISLVLRPPAEGDKGLILNCLRRQGDSTTAVTMELADPDDWPSLAYKEQFFALDPFVNLPEGKTVTLAELVPEADLKTSAYYQNFLKPAGVLHILGADTRAEDGTLARLRISRGPDEAAFGDGERQICNRLVPHLRRAILLHARLNRIESERALFASAMDKLAVGTILLDEHGKILNSNALASTLLSRKDGLGIHDNRLCASHAGDNQQLQALIQDVRRAQQNQEPGMVKATRLPRPSGRPDLGIVVKPVPTSLWSEGQASPAVAVFISDPEQQLCTSQQTLIELFSFSRAESALAVLLTRGLTLAEASDELNISQHTARAQLKAIFAKTGVTRQAELIRLIIKSVAELA